MKVLIANINKEIVESVKPKNMKTLVFTPETKNTCTFEVSKISFDALVRSAELKGFNRFTLFSW